MTSYSFTLPFPPSVNGLFANVGKRRIKTKRYTEWRKAAQWQVKAGHRIPPFAERFRADIRLVAPDKRTRDLDNYAKAILDALTGLVYIDDKQIKELYMSWEDSAEFQGAFVTIKPIK